MIEQLTSAQAELLAQPLQRRLFLSGPAGSGKTTAGTARALQWIQAGIPAEEILILVPQRSLALPYYEALRDPALPPGGVSDILTFGGLGQRLIALFWPLIAEEAGFQHPDRPPSFLTLETAQYVLSGIMEPLIDEDYFIAVNMDPNRLLSQVIDNLNKAAAIGIDHRTVAECLSAAWVGKQADQPLVYQHAQEGANAFRAYCYAENLLDFSLQLELFTNHAWHLPAVREWLRSQYRYLIYDNIEEDVPAVHDRVLEWLPDFDGALCILDDDAGYRLFLGADPESALRLAAEADAEIAFPQSLVTPPVVAELDDALQVCIRQPGRGALPDGLRDGFELETSARFHPEMIQHACLRARQLVEKGVPPEEIVMLAPFLSDSLRFSLERELRAHGLESYTTRPSRSLGDEPVTRCLLALARLANPAWGDAPAEADVTQALVLAIDGFDLVRASLLRRIIYRPQREGAERLASFSEIQPDMQERISYQAGQRYEDLRGWLLFEQQSHDHPDLDVFLSRLFGEVLSQPGFAFHRDLEAAAVTARLIESVQKFRRGMAFLLEPEPLGPSLADRVGAEYVRMLEQGVIAAQYLQTWEPQPAGTILLAPAHTFLMSNRPARCQFWLDAGSSGWWQRLDQPLTHPVVLSRRWEPGRKWTDVEEVAFNTAQLARLTRGLLRRCAEKVFIYTAEIDQSGYENSGLLLQALQNLLLRLPPETGAGRV